MYQPSRRIGDVDKKPFADGGKRCLDLADMRAMAEMQEPSYGTFAHTELLCEHDVRESGLSHRGVERELGSGQRRDADENLATPKRTGSW